MDPETLRGHLSTLHEELRDARQIDPRSSALLGEVLKDIQRILDADNAEARAGAVPLADRLEKVAVQFEADHPALAASSRRLIDLLGKVGL
jgi:phytoene/squalene synthetase